MQGIPYLQICKEKGAYTIARYGDFGGTRQLVEFDINASFVTPQELITYLKDTTGLGYLLPKTRYTIEELNIRR
jgi:hypothetical protein